MLTTKPHTHTCRHCGSRFTPKHSRNKNLYCSQQCSARARSEAHQKPVHFCEQCGAEFTPHSGPSPSKYCSYKCHGEAMMLTEPPKPCAYCGTLFSQRGNEYANQFRKRRFCSRECRYAHKALATQKPRTQLVCRWCGSEFSARQPTNSRPARIYCSGSCREHANADRKRPRCECLHCGTAFYRVPANPGKFCSRNCQFESMRVSHQCAQCGNTVKRSRSVSPEGSRVFCTRECHALSMIGLARNSSQPAQHPREYPHGFTRSLRRLIRKRDGHECQLCGDGPNGLHVHHINYDKHDINPTNLISLCSACHGKTNHHRDYWQTYFTVNAPEPL